MRRWLARIFYGALSAFVILTAVAYVFIGTPTGSRWLLETAVQLSHGQLAFSTVRGSLLGGLDVDGLRWQSAELEIDIAHAGLLWRPLDLFAGRLQIDALTAQHVLVVRHAPPASTAATSPASPTTLPALPLAVHVGALSIDDLVVVEQGTPMRIARIRGEFSLAGNRLHLTRLSVRTPQGGLAVVGELDLAPAMALDLRTAWDWQLAGGKALKGHGTLQGKLTALRIEQHLKQPFQARIAGQIDVPAQNATLSLSWQQARWPLSGPAQVESRTGTLRLSGGLDAYRLDLKADLRAGTLDIPHLAAQAGGNREKLDLQRLTAALLNGTLKASGSIAWQPALAWHLDLQGSGLNPGLHWTDWPGRLNLQAALSGDARTLHFDLSRLEGALRTRPVQARARGSLDLVTHELSLDPSHLRVLDATLDLAGHAGSARGNLKFSLDVPQLHAFTAQAQGGLRASGSLAGPWTWPRIDARISGEKLQLRDLRIARLQGSIIPSSNNALVARLALSGVRRGSLKLNRILLNASGHPSSQRLSLSAESADAHLNLSLEGGFSHAFSRWQGRLTRLATGTRVTGDWKLTRPAMIDVSRGQYAVSPLCLQDTRDASAHLCAQMKLAGSQLNAQADWARIPLSLLDTWLPASVHVGGLLHGRAEVTGTTAAPQVMLTAAAPDAYLETGQNASRMRYPLALKQVEASLHQQKFALTLQAGLPGKGSLDARVDSGLAADAPLHGNLRANLPDLAFLNGLIPGTEHITGTLQGDVTLDGTRSTPAIGGQITLDKGAFTLPQAGIRLHEMHAVLSGKPHAQSLQLALQAKSGPGNINATGQVEHWLTPRPQVHLQIDGQRFEAVHLPQVTALISPKLIVDADPALIRVRGNIEVPQADITLKRMPPGAVDVSADTRIVGSEASAPAAGPQHDISVNLILGKNVKLDAFGLAGQLNGSLLLNQHSGSPATADGSLSIVNGTYAAYGLNLTISRGVLNFAGPVDNPGLDIVAQRQTGDVTAQLTVTGTLKTPRSRVSATPPMSESEALSWLITGHGLAGSSKSDAALLLKALASMHLDQGGGSGGLLSTLKARTGLSEIGVQGGDSLQQSALLLGKYLTPDLYVRYAAGLFDHSNTLALNYRLSQHFSVEAKSGTAQGIDLLYQIVFGPR
ncbi:hypothetical protein BJI67_05490 [Acidihalobacter aeolianus]|uniref:Translocation and assembly module TamB C-terminal domain-containing protein n=1 Tax=Acidihalobacter aeolianus TaxID=2792603 RepID=A0A1D8K6L5_9GAMM|nr:translocation/assembly module TamB domain-containing protein [Acidihalobacter aeolianus]AOV16594.1 hypothetical protein BJI67_05490 [Acidihalobacter aeolianus]